MAVGPDPVASQRFRLHVPLLREVVQGPAIPRARPPQRPVAPVTGLQGRGHVGHDRLGLEVDLAARPARQQAEVDVLRRAHHSLVQRADPIEHLAPYEHRVELHHLARLAAELVPHLGKRAVEEAMALVQGAILDSRLAPRHVDEVRARLALEI